MTEKLLQFIWQFQYFNKDSLFTSSGEPLGIIHPGKWNTQQGPDFDEGKIKIGNTTWAGTIEVHVKASDWQRHGHQHDGRYQKVILHVVWQNDLPVEDSRGNTVPTLELASRVSNLLLDQYDHWMQNPQALACGSAIANVSDLVWTNWKEKLLVERLMQKHERIAQHLNQTNKHWEEVLWRMLCRYFGGSTNATSFEQIAESLPLSILAKHKNQIHQLEALLLGQAGLLHKNLQDDYARMLYREYQHLQQKYGLRVINLPPAFLRMRPGNFPTVRLAQLAMLLQQSNRLFAHMQDCEKLAQLRELLAVTANDYWHYRYKMDEPSDYRPKTLGSDMIDILLINAIIPVLFAYGNTHKLEGLKQKALRWLEEIPAEANQAISPFKQYGIPAPRAYDTQALLQLRKQYCDARRCLQCMAGNALLRQSKHQLQV